VVVACVVAFGLALILRQLARRFSARDHRARWVCNVAISGGLLGLLSVTPLAFGSVSPWGIALLERWVLLLARLWGLSWPQGGRLRLVRMPWHLPILAVLGLVGWQLLPLPPSLLGLRSPHTSALSQRTLTGWPDQPPLALLAPAPPAQASGPVSPPRPPGEGRGAGAPATSLWRPLSRYPHATRAALWQALASAAVCLIVANTVQTRRQLTGVLVTRMGVGGVMAVVGPLGVLLVVGGLGWFGWQTLRRWSRRHTPEGRGIVLGGLAGVFAMGLHRGVDVPLHSPANALRLALLVGITWVAVHLRREQGRWVALGRVHERPLGRLPRLVLSPRLRLVTGGLALPAVRDLVADRQAQVAAEGERGASAVDAPETLVAPWASVVALAPGHADDHDRLGLAYARIMHAQRARAPLQALAAGVQAATADREAILRNPTSPFPSLAWGWALEGVGQLATWAAGQPALVETSLRLGRQDVHPLITSVEHHPEPLAVFARQLVETATAVAPTAACGHARAGLSGMRPWETLASAERMDILQELRAAAALEPAYAATLLHALGDRTHDRDLLGALARGTPEETRWGAEERKAVLRNERAHAHTRRPGGAHESGAVEKRPCPPSATAFSLSPGIAQLPCAALLTYLTWLALPLGSPPSAVSCPDRSCLTPSWRQPPSS
jgi:hypothetical protein